MKGYAHKMNEFLNKRRDFMKENLSMEELIKKQKEVLYVDVENTSLSGCDDLGRRWKTAGLVYENEKTGLRIDIESPYMWTMNKALEITEDGILHYLCHGIAHHQGGATRSLIRHPYIVRLKYQPIYIDSMESRIWIKKAIWYMALHGMEILKEKEKLWESEIDKRYREASHHKKCGSTKLFNNS